MWLMTTYGFFSVAQSQHKPSLLMVRARTKKHLKNLKKRFTQLHHCRIKKTQLIDYRFRIFVKRKVWIKISAELASEIDYSNFKNQVKEVSNDQRYLNALHTVWSTMFDLQEPLSRSAFYPDYEDDQLLFPCSN